MSSMRAAAPLGTFIAVIVALLVYVFYTVRGGSLPDFFGKQDPGGLPQIDLGYAIYKSSAFCVSSPEFE